MADIAKLGFSVDSGALVDAKAKLDALVPAADRAQKATDKFNAAANGLGNAGKGKGMGGFVAGVQSAAEGAGVAARRIASVGDAARGSVRSAMMLGSAMGTVQQAATGAAGAIRITGMAAQQYGPPTSAWRAYREELAKVPAAANNAKSSLDRLGASANDNINRMQSTPGNIAAQFQDIGVTAAGGMSPLLIGLQQGTQLSAAFQGGLKNLIPALAQVFNVTSLLTIALVAGLAILIQWAMAAFKASSETDKLSDAIRDTEFTTSALKDAQGALGLVMDLATGKINTQSEALMGLAAAQLEVIRVTALRDKAEAAKTLTAASRRVVAVETLVETSMGTDVGYERRRGIESDAIEAFQRGNRTAKDTIDQLTAMQEQGQLTTETYLGLIEAVSNYGMAQENLQIYQQGATALAGGPVAERFLDRDKPKRTPKGINYAQRFQDITEGAQNDISTENARAAAIGKSVEQVAQMTQQTKLLNALNSAGITPSEQQLQIVTDLARQYARAKVEADRLTASNAIEQSAFNDLENIKLQTDAVGLYGRELIEATKFAELLNAARSTFANDNEGLTAIRDQLRQTAADYAQAQDTLNRATYAEETRRQSEMTVFQMDRERGALGLLGEELIAYNYVTQELVRAKQQQITLGPQEVAAIQAAGNAYAAQRHEIDRSAEALDFARSSTRSFLGDLQTGLRNGEGVFRSFTNAVTNMLDKVIDKLLDVAVNAGFGKGGSGGGILSAITGLFTGGTAAAAAGNGSNMTGAIARPFAKGGVVDSPTFFAAGGGANVAGEAGPEGILPLKRGGDGSLGVQVHGGGGRAAPPVVNVTNQFTIAGAIDGGTIAAQIRQSAEQTKDDVRRAVPAILAEYQQNGALA